MTVERRTRQGDAVAAQLEGYGEFVTAQQLHDDLRHAGLQVGLATVYRRLQALAEAGRLDVIRTPEGQAAYRRCNTGHHHHLICRVCGRTVELAGEEFESWLGRMAERHGFAELDHALEVYGRCEGCRG